MDRGNFLLDIALQLENQSSRLERFFRRDRIVAELPKPLADIFRQQRRFFHSGKVAAARHGGPTLYIEKALRPFARRLTDVLRKEREGRRHF